MNCVGSSGRRPHDQSRAVAAVECRSLKLKEEKNMSCCSDVMKPVKPSACCTPQDTATHAAQAMRDSGCGCAPVVESTDHLKLVGVVTERDVCCGVAADDRRASKRSCDPCLPVVRRASRLKKRAGDSTSSARRACPLRTKRGVVAAQSAFTIWRNRRATDEGTAQCDTLMEAWANTSPRQVTENRGNEPVCRKVGRISGKAG